MTTLRCSATCCAIAVAVSFGCAHAPPSPDQLRAPSLGAPTPDSLGSLFVHRFAADSPAAFDSVDPDSESRTVMHGAVKRKLAREPGLSRVVWRNSNRAILLLTGTVKADNGGDETNLVRHLSGLYEASQRGGSWSITRQLPIDTLNYIHGQALHVELSPGRDIAVVDTLAIAVGGRWGLAARLNNDVRLSTVRLDGDSIAWAFGGGVLWIDAPQRAHSQLVLNYTLRDANVPPKDTASGAPADSIPAFGAYHNTDAWHPVFSYTSANGMATMSLTVRLPAAYHLTTTLPQTEVVANGVRTVTGRSTYPAWLLTMIYDRDWKVATSDVDGVTFETFTTPSFDFSHDTLATALRRIDPVLGKRFGGPTPPYIAVVEDRALGARGFSVRMTDAVITGTKASHLDQTGIHGPVAAFSHEVSHGWTMNATGPAANMLREGWATFAEATVLGAEHGASVENDFWNRLRNGYMLGSEGRLSIVGNPDNGGVHYSKGAWIFRMFESLLGDSAFDRAIRTYVQLQADAKPAGYRELIASMSSAGGRDMTSFAMPWFTEKVIPDVRAEIAGRRVILTQAQATAPFDLPLDLAITMASGTTIRRALHLNRRADTLEIPGADSIIAVHVDPEHRLLLQRHWGEHARFELPVDRAKGAKAVAIVGDFSLTAVPATRQGDSWVVDLPLTEGRYVWCWQLDGAPRAIVQGGDPGTDGDPSLTFVRYVRPVQLLSDSYPKSLQPIP
jgi:peptidase M1-like protein